MQVSNSIGDHNAKKQFVCISLTSSSDSSLLPNRSVHWVMDEIASGTTLANNLNLLEPISFSWYYGVLDSFLCWVCGFFTFYFVWAFFEEDNGLILVYVKTTTTTTTKDKYHKKMRAIFFCCCDLTMASN